MHGIPSREARQRANARRNEARRLETAFGACRDCPYSACIHRPCRTLRASEQVLPSGIHSPGRVMVDR